MLDVVWWLGSQYRSLELHSKLCKLRLKTCEALFRCQVAGLYCIVNKVLVVEGFFKVLINASEVGAEYFDNVIQLATYATR